MAIEEDNIDTKEEDGGEDTSDYAKAENTNIDP
jgi:hypothetical protein